MAWKLRRLIKDANGNVTNTDWPGDPGSKTTVQQRMVTEAAVDVTDLHFDLTSLSAVALNLTRAGDGKRREYDVLEA